jgi:multidrug efflux system outer membrane protein
MKRVAALIPLLLAGCSMEPAYVRPGPAVPPSWPAGDSYLRQSEAALPSVTYQQVFRDPRLQTIIGEALENNRDLMVAAANIAAAREQYRIQRANQLPQVNAVGGATVQPRNPGSGIDVQTDAGVQIPAFEIDLFGRIRSQSHAALNRYLATEAGARATRLTLVSGVASAWLTYASDATLLEIAENTVDVANKSVRLTRLRLEGGIAPRTDLRQAEQVRDQALADAADQRTALAQDANLLQLLVGSPVDPSLLPKSIDEAFGTIVGMPAGTDSYVLLRRPDVVQAEYELRAANADIGAARAALFPRISIQSLLGFAGSSVGTLFGSLGWSAGASGTYSIFNAGAGRANVHLTEAQQRAAVATYQHAIQTAFREVADALARGGTINERLAAQQSQKEAAGDTFVLTDARYREGIDPFLNVLEAQRNYYTAQRDLAVARLTAAQNLVDLYQALGGDSLYPPPTLTAASPNRQ